MLRHIVLIKCKPRYRRRPIGSVHKPKEFGSKRNLTRKANLSICQLNQDAIRKDESFFNYIYYIDFLKAYSREVLGYLSFEKVRHALVKIMPFHITVLFTHKKRFSKAASTLATLQFIESYSEIPPSVGGSTLSRFMQITSQETH